MLTLDPTTLGEYDNFIAAGDRAQAVLDALDNPVVVKVYDGNGQVMGQGTMGTPWATRTDGVLTVGALSAFQVLASGTPDPETWYLRFESGSRWLQGTFGLAASGADFTWSLASWSAGQNGQIGAVATTAYDVPVVFGWTFAQGAGEAYNLNVTVNPGGTVTIPSNLYAIPVGQTASWSLVGQADGTTITPTSQAGEPVVITVGENVANTSSYDVVVDLQAANSAAADWEYRSTLPGVVWAHSFDTSTELTAFDALQPTGYAGEQVSGSWQSGAGAAGLPGFIRYRQPGNGPAFRVIAATYLGGGVTEFQTGSSAPADSGTPAAHGLQVGDQISFQSMGSTLTWGRLNRTFGKSGGVQFGSAGCFVQSVPTANTFRIALDSSTWGAYSATPGGRCQKWAIGNGSWNRPLSPLLAGANGKADPDYAKNGTMTRRAWSGPSNASSWYTGWYGHTDYHTQQLTPSDWDGDEYYLQYRVRFSAGRFRTPDQPSGKLVMHSGVHTDVDHLIEQAITYYRYAESSSTPAWDNTRTLFGADPAITARPQMYATKWAFASITSPPSGFTGAKNFQTDAYPNTCYYVSLAPSSGGLGQGSGFNACWWWPEEEWVTVLLRVKFGKNNTREDFFADTPTATKDMTIEMWVAKQGETQYTKIFSENRLSWRWDGLNAIMGWNAVRLTSYMNEEPGVTELWHDFDQVILSHEFIPCPQY